MNTLPFNIFSAIIAPLFVPWLEWTLYHSEAYDLNGKIKHLRGQRIKQKSDDDYLPKKPEDPMIFEPKLIDSFLNPFFHGLPGAFIGNIIWGLTYDLERFNSWWFCLYLFLLFLCVGFVNIVKTKCVINRVWIYILLGAFELLFIVLAIFRLMSFKNGE